MTEVIDYSKNRPKFIEAEWEIKHPILKAIQLLPGEEAAMSFVERISNALDQEVASSDFRLVYTHPEKKDPNYDFSLTVVFRNGRQFYIKAGQWFVFYGDGTTDVQSHDELSHRYNLKETK